MALTHVCMWSEKSWKRISAYEAAKMFPCGTSVHSGLFMCELCGQYVTLIKGSIQSSHFRHNAYEKNKDCDDRNKSYSYSNYFQAEAHSLPIKIKIDSSNRFSLSIGFIALPDAMMQGKGNFKILITGTEQFQYYFNRLNKGTITYLDVGTKPSSSYKVSVIPDVEGVKSYWPAHISGIEREGTLFDKSTGKKLPYDADVQVGREYYLLTSHSQYRDLKTISKNEICSHMEGEQNWRVFEVKATEFNEEAAKFFLGYHCRLTNEPITMYPIWPVYIESPYVIYHKSKHLNIYFRGNAEPQLAPVGGITRYPYLNPKLLSVTSKDRQQLLSAGRTEVLKYMYFWEAELDEKGHLPEISIIDLNKNDIEEGVYNTLPNKNTICVIPQVDGVIKIYKKDILLDKYEISAGSRFEYDGIDFGVTIKIFQGLDCVWKTTYEKNRMESIEEEGLLLYRLRSLNGRKIRTNHSIGALVNAFSKNSPIRTWIYTQIKNGVIQEESVKYIQRYLEQNKRRG